MNANEISILERELNALGHMLRGPVLKVLLSWIKAVQKREPVDDAGDHDYETKFEVSW